MQVVEDRAAHRVDRVGQRVEAVEDRSHCGRPETGKSAPERKYIGMINICVSAMNDCICLIARRGHHAERGDREGEHAAAGAKISRISRIGA